MTSTFSGKRIDTGNISPFGIPINRSQRNLPTAGARGNLAVSPLYHQGIARTDFETKVDNVSTSLLGGSRLGSHKSDLLAQLSSSGHLSKNSIVTALNSTDRKKRMSLTPIEFAQMISSDYMKISDAAKILSEKRVSETIAAQTFVSLYSRSPERLAALMLSRDMSKFRLADIIGKAIMDEKSGGEDREGPGLSGMMTEMLRSHISPASAPEILYYIDNGIADEILNALNDRTLKKKIISETDGYIPASKDLIASTETFLLDPARMRTFGLKHNKPAEKPSPQRVGLLHPLSEDDLVHIDNKKELLELIIGFMNDINRENTGKLNEETLIRNIRHKSILMDNVALMIRHLGIDETAETLGRRKARDIAIEILSNCNIPLKEKARILNSEKFDRDSASYVMSGMEAPMLVDILESIESQTNPIISYDHLTDLIKSRHFTLGKALSLFGQPGFTRARFALGNRKINDVLMNVILYYFPKEDARDLITRSGRNEAQLKDVLADMYEPSINEPCVP